MNQSISLDEFEKICSNVRQNLDFKRREVFCLGVAAACAAVLPPISTLGAVVAFGHMLKDCWGVRKSLNEMRSTIPRHCEFLHDSEGKNLVLGAGHPTIVLNRLNEIGILKSIQKGATQIGVYALAPVAGAYCGLEQLVQVNSLMYCAIGVSFLAVSLGTMLGAESVYRKTKCALREKWGQYAMNS